MKTSQKLYSIAQAAEALGVNRSTIYRRVVSGEILTLAGTGIVRIPASELDRYLGNTRVYQPKFKK
jgi:excisionase family DNA binding protein